MNSPFTSGSATLKTESITISFRKEEFVVVSQYYVCDDTGEEFTTSEQDELTINQAYNQYREKHGIPFVDEINEILDKYGISALKMSKILGFGDNQYLKYSKGEIPSVSNGRLIAMIKDVAEFKKLLVNAQNEFTPEEFAKIEKKILPLQDANTSFIERLISESSFLGSEKSINTGYRLSKIPKIKNMMLFFLNQCGGVFETKLNKLMFYCDFLCFKETGLGMSGLRYKAIQFGPVPLQYSTVYQNVGGIEVQIEAFPDGYAGTKYVGKESFNPELFTAHEITVMERVLEKFRDCNAGMISNISHKEDAWIENESTQSIIKYDYAFMLREL